MFSRSHGSKNSGGGRGAGAFASHLFNRQLLAKPTSSRAAADSRPGQSVRKTAGVSDPDGSGAGRCRRDAVEDRSSPVQLVSVRLTADEATATTRVAPSSGAEVGGGVGRRTKLGLSVAVVREPCTMNSGSAPASSSSSKSADVVNDQRDTPVAIDNRQQNDDHSSDTSVSVGDAQTMKEAGEYTASTRFVLFATH